MRVSDFDFELPEDLIALRPVAPRDSARLLIVREGSLSFEEAQVRDLPRFLKRDDGLVFNDTRVIPAQLSGVRSARGGSGDAHIDVTLHKRIDPETWAAFAKPGRKLALGDRVNFGGGLKAELIAKHSGGEVVLHFSKTGNSLDRAVALSGAMPLPPYIAARRPPDERDARDYQTMFAARDGAVAAPTAGLHFTPALIEQLRKAGVRSSTVTLHVGAGTFLPVKVDDTQDHHMHAEWGEVSDHAAADINAVRDSGGRVICVGTTSLRLVESAAEENGRVQPFKGDTSIFITPGYRFRAAQMLVTNFHLPRSTLFMLVSAFCGLETMRAAYQYAIDKRFRFYSYGDACLLIRNAR
ncbi:MAG: tRNA preQ1(34) S-adenosylmethionine ribosyltransferase-isomerase QueA [Alphaproteobacteria bacterium]|nr:tRNA preQ1(34) S-adenosylmethionine ribosyltransferase-isomerase QueA [Alphaproteobacteria bacterium]